MAKNCKNVFWTFFHEYSSKKQFFFLEKLDMFSKILILLTHVKTLIGSKTPTIDILTYEFFWGYCNSRIFLKYIFEDSYIGLSRNKKTEISALKFVFSNALFEDIFSKIIDIHEPID